MVGLNQFNDYEDCLKFLRENKGFNTIAKIDLNLAPDKIYKTYYWCERFQDWFVSDNSTTIEKIGEIFEEPFSEITISYRLMPTKTRELFTLDYKMTKNQLMNSKGFLFSSRALEYLHNEILNHLVEG